MARISINDKHFVTGNNIVVVDGEVVVDGKRFTDNTPNINVVVHGDLNKLDCNDAEINGNVMGDVDANNVTCEIIGGNVDGNTINATNIGGDVDANVVNCKYIEGDVDANVVNK